MEWNYLLVLGSEATQLDVDAKTTWLGLGTKTICWI